MAKEGGWMPPPPQTGFYNYPLEWENLYLQAKFLAAGLFLGHLSMKTFFRSDLLSWL